MIRHDEFGSCLTSEFVTDVKAIPERAASISRAARSSNGYKADRASVVKVLNTVLAIELVCMLRYKRHYFTTTGINAEAEKEEFQQHAAQEQSHGGHGRRTDHTARRAADFNPVALAGRSHSPYAEGKSLVDMNQGRPGRRTNRDRVPQRDSSLDRR